MPRPEVVAMRLPPTLVAVAVSPTAAASPTGALPAAAALRVVAPEGIPLWQRRVPGVAVQRVVSLPRAALPAVVTKWTAAAALRVVALEAIPPWQRRVPGVAVQRAVSLSRAA